MSNSNIELFSHLTIEVRSESMLQYILESKKPQIFLVIPKDMGLSQKYSQVHLGYIFAILAAIMFGSVSTLAKPLVSDKSIIFGRAD